MFKKGDMIKLKETSTEEIFFWMSKGDKSWYFNKLKGKTWIIEKVDKKYITIDGIAPMLFFKDIEKVSFKSIFNKLAGDVNV